MKHRLSSFFFSLMGAFFAATAFAASGDVSLYLSPDASAPAFLQVPASDARLADAKPATSGWKIVTLSGPFTAYVRSNTTHKDLTVTPGTPVYAAANAGSAVIGTAPASPLLSIKSADIDWATVTYAGPVTVYFKNATPEAKPAVAIPVVAAPVVAAPAQPAAVTAQPLAATVTASPAAVPQNYYGTLKLRTNPFIDGPINAQYLLYSDKGALVALVDLSDVVLGSPVANYLGKSVKVYGTAYTAKNLPSVVIRAQMLQTN